LDSFPLGEDDFLCEEYDEEFASLMQEYASVPEMVPPADRNQIYQCAGNDDERFICGNHQDESAISVSSTSVSQGSSLKGKPRAPQETTSKREQERCQSPSEKTFLRFFPRSKSTRSTMAKAGYKKPKYEMLVPNNWTLNRVFSKLNLKWPKGFVPHIFPRGSKPSCGWSPEEVHLTVDELATRLGKGTDGALALSYAWTAFPGTPSCVSATLLHKNACADLLAAVDGCAAAVALFRDGRPSPVGKAATVFPTTVTGVAAVTCTNGVRCGDSASGAVQRSDEPNKRPKKRIKPTFLRASMPI